MNYYLIIFYLVLVFFGLWYYFRQKSKTKGADDPELLNNLQQAHDFLQNLDTFSDYVTWVQREHIKTHYAELRSYFRRNKRLTRKESVVARFIEIYDDLEGFVAEHNQRYVSSQKDRLSSFFDNIEGKSLDDQQRTAVVTDEYSNLIVAGAGSGKTLTILGKVKYLIEQKGIAPKDILLLSFTRKTVEELNERLRNSNLGTEATTFHKLGYEIIRKYQPVTPTVTNETTLTRVIEAYLDTDIFNDTKALQAFVQYVACYMNIPEPIDSYKSLGEKLDTEKGIDFQTLRSKVEPLNKVAKSVLDTMQGERVKSVEELMIANFLYLNGIDYEYERPYPHGDFLYRPDFYLKQYDVYLEHFGVDENNQAKWLTPLNEKKYVDSMFTKREWHKQYNTRLIETYSYFNKQNQLLQKLEELLKEVNIPLRPRDAREIYQKITSRDQRFGEEITKLIESFINLSKSKRLSVDELMTLYTGNKNADHFTRQRQFLFLQFVLHVLGKYNSVLEEKNEIDFNDMINSATALVETHKPGYTYKYIIIDEYQDISLSRFNLIKEIRELCGARLTCVGDDWQSIYRFAGSDVSLFSNFEKYVGKCETILIEQTYRNSQSLIDISSKFIKKNPTQIKKYPKSRKPALPDPVKFVPFNEGEAEACFLKELQVLQEKYGNKSVLVLGRHSFDINELIKLTPDSRISHNERTGKLSIKGFEQLDIQYLTVHKSKGTEADNVIVLNLKNHLLGFPNKMTDDPILSLLLNEKEEYRFAEERRLFYVALTRTKNEVVLLIPSDVSLFAEELMADNNYLLSTSNGKLNTTNCPYCKTGKLVIRQNSTSQEQFLGCSHFPVCNQTFKDIEILEHSYLCPECRSGFMTRKTGKFGAFLGCTNYPICRKTINLE